MLNCVLYPIQIMRSLLFIIVLCFSSSHWSNGQDRNILKGATELRKIVLENYATNILQLEKIREKLDSLEVSDRDYEWFCHRLNYVSRNLYNEELRGRQSMVDLLKESKIYNALNESELATVIDNFELLSIPKTGIWNERYPHKIDVNSLRLKEISNFGVNKGDRILHFHAINNHLCEIYFLSYDSIDITHHPISYLTNERKLFEVISKEKGNSTSALNYPLTEHAKLDTDQKYDIIVFDALGVISYQRYEGFNKKFSQIRKMLKDDGELIISGNYFRPPFDGPFRDIDLIDEKTKRVTKLGFILKEKLYVENEFLTYKFIKDSDYD